MLWFRIQCVEVLWQNFNSSVLSDEAITMPVSILRHPSMMRWIRPITTTCVYLYFKILCPSFPLRGFRFTNTLSVRSSDGPGRESFPSSNVVVRLPFFAPPEVFVRELAQGKWCPARKTERPSICFTFTLWGWLVVFFGQYLRAVPCYTQWGLFEQWIFLDQHNIP